MLNWVWYPVNDMLTRSTNTPAPIIIIGAARSGTKFLRDVLASVDGVCCVPYDVNYVWRYGAEDAPSDILDPDTLDNERIKFIRSTLLELARAKPGEVLVEKTVSNTLRVPFLDRVYPNARYVHLIRDGRDVTESAMRQWQGSPNLRDLWVKLKSVQLANTAYVFWFAKNFLKGLLSGRKGGGVWGPRFPGINEALDIHGLVGVCALQWVESVTRASRDLQNLSDFESRVFRIRYEDLMTNEGKLVELVEALDLPHEKEIIANYRATLRPSKPALWHRLSSTEKIVLNRIISLVEIEPR